MTCVRVARGAGFKRCCLRAGKYDGSNRDYFFPRVENRPARRRKNGGPEILLTFAFCSPIVRGGRGNGKRVARRLHLPTRLSRAGRRQLKVPSRKRGEGSTCKTIPRLWKPTASASSLGDSIGVPLPYQEPPMDVCVENVFITPAIEAINVIQATAEGN